jgi:hypothetical protein
MCCSFHSTHEKNFKVLAARQVDLVKVKGKTITKPKLRPCGMVWRKNTSLTSSSRGVKIDTEEGLAAEETDKTQADQEPSCYPLI